MCYEKVRTLKRRNNNPRSKRYSKGSKHIARKDQTYDQLIKELLNLKGITVLK